MDIKDMLNLINNSVLDMSSLQNGKNANLLNLLPLLMNMQKGSKSDPKIVDNEINSTIKKLFD